MPEPHHLRLPNFIIAGAPTCGTTSLHHYLAQHPQVYMSPIKEPTTFAAEDMRAHVDFSRAIDRQSDALRRYLAGPMTEPARFWVTAWEDYQSLFAQVRDQTAIGEGSVSYFWLPGAAAAIRRKIPAMKFIFMLRDPTDRLFSWYLMTLREEPGTSFRDRLQRELRDPSGDSRSLLRQLDGGKYATHLRRFLDLFPREQMRIHLYESFRANPGAVLRDILAFLGVDPAQPINLSYRHNETILPRFPVLQGWRQAMQLPASATRWLPSPVKAALRRFYYRPRGSLVMDPEDRQLALPYFREEILRTQDLIGRDLSAWLR